MNNNKVKLKEAISAGKTRNYKKAVKILLGIIQISDDNPEAFLYLGRSYYALGQYALSLQYLRIFLDYNSDSAIGHFFMGRSYLASGLVKRAIPHFQISIKKHPESAHARGFLGIALMKTGRFETALKYLGEAIELSSDNYKIFEIYLHCLLIVAIRKFNSGELDISKQMFQFFIGYITDKVLPYIYLGMIERQEGNDSAALDYYDKAIKLSPDDELLLFRRAILLYKTGHEDLAVSQLNRLDIGGYDTSTPIKELKENRFLAFRYFQQNYYKEAVYFGREALKENPSDIDMHLIMAESFRNLKNYDFSKNHYKKAIQIDRSRVEARYGFVLLLWHTEEYEEMLDELRKIASMDPDKKISSYYAALIYCKLNYNTDITIPTLQQQIHENPSDPFLFQFLGDEYLKGGFENLAEKWFLKAIEITGGKPENYRSLIETYRKTNEKKKLIKAMKNYFDAGLFDYEIAVEFILLLYSMKYYKQVIKEAEIVLGYKRNSRISRILANSYRLTGKFDKAIIIYKYLLKDNPDNLIFLKALLYCMDKAGDTANSIILLDNALKYIKRADSSLYLILGVLLYKTGQLDKAQAVFRENISRFPDDWRSYMNLGSIYKEQGLADFADRFLSEAETRKKRNK